MCSEIGQRLLPLPLHFSSFTAACCEDRWPCFTYMDGPMTQIKRRNGFTLIEMAIVLLVISILTAIAIPSYMRCRENSKIRVCRSHLRHLQDAKDRWAIENRKTSSDKPTFDDLIPTYLKGAPVCPNSGTYELGAVGENVTCTTPGHTIY